LSFNILPFFLLLVRSFIDDSLSRCFGSCRMGFARGNGSMFCTVISILFLWCGGEVWYFVDAADHFPCLGRGLGNVRGYHFCAPIRVKRTTLRRQRPNHLSLFQVALYGARLSPLLLSLFYLFILSHFTRRPLLTSDSCCIRATVAHPSVPSNAT